MVFMHNLADVPLEVRQPSITASLKLLIILMIMNYTMTGSRDLVPVPQLYQIV